MFTQTLPAGQSRSDVVEARQYEPAVHVAFVAELTQKLPAGHGNDTVDPAAQ